MANLYNDNGSWIVRFIGADGQRHKVRLGKASKDVAEGAKYFIERMAQAARLNQPMPSEAVNWLARVSDQVYARLAREGLCEPREASVAMPLEQMLNKYIAIREVDMKPWSVKMLRQCRNKLVEHFGPSAPVNSIKEADAEGFKRVVGLGVSKAYVAKLVIISKAFFNFAVKSKFIEANPFATLKAGSQKNRQRQRFVSAETVHRVIADEPDPQRALVYALARFGGLRIPSELLGLRWSDIDFKRQRVLIHSPKTERHDGKATRTMPLFPELVEPLMKVKASLPPSEPYVVPKFRDAAKNLRTHLLKHLDRLGIASWPRLFQNLRSSRQTELCERYPIQDVCDWLGNTPEVALDHYLQSRRESMVAAAMGAPILVSQNASAAARSGPAEGGNASQGEAPLFGGFPTSVVFAVVSDPMPQDAAGCRKG